MKLLLIIAVFLALILALGQSDTSSDSVDYGLDEYHEKYPEQLGKPDFDSVSLELRFWVSGHDFSGMFIKLTKDHQGDWKYRRGFIDDNDKVVILPDLADSPNMDSLWQILQTNNILTLPDQKNSTFILSNGDKETTLNEKQKQKIIENTQGDFYIIEIFGSAGYRQYGYSAPEKIYKMCLSNKLGCDKHEKMIEIASLFSQSFKIQDMVIEKFRGRKKEKKR